jgi:translation initiation factor 2 alpha subunit (eIF-2alpha)
MTNPFTLRIGYKPNYPIYSTSVDMNKNEGTIEEIASALAKKCTEKQGKNWTKRRREAYEFGHYKLILQYLETKYG